MQQESPTNRRLSLKALLDAYERQLILTALAATAGNQRRAAAALGLLPTTLHEKMKRLGLVRRLHAPAEVVPPEADVVAAQADPGPAV
jgi:DNA-binding NtrC family response regulator